MESVSFSMAVKSIDAPTPEAAYSPRFEASVVVMFTNPLGEEYAVFAEPAP